jgi:hypothetical protein
LLVPENKPESRFDRRGLVCFACQSVGLDRVHLRELSCLYFLCCLLSTRDFEIPRTSFGSLQCGDGTLVVSRSQEPSSFSSPAQMKLRSGSSWQTWPGLAQPGLRAGSGRLQMSPPTTGQRPARARARAVQVGFRAHTATSQLRVPLRGAKRPVSAGCRSHSPQCIAPSVSRLRRSLMPVASACDAGRVTNLTSVTVASALGPRICPSPPQRPPGPSRLDPAWGARGPPARGFPPSRPEGDGHWQALPLSVTPPLRGVFVGFKVLWSR